MLRPFNLCEGVSEPHSFDFETAGLRQTAMTELPMLLVTELSSIAS